MARWLSVQGVSAIVDPVWGATWVVKFLIHVVGVLLSSHDERMQERKLLREGKVGTAEEPNNERLVCREPTVALCGSWPKLYTACVAEGNRVTLLLFLREGKLR